MEVLESGFFYHIYNRGNNKQDIFIENDNYHYFLKLMIKYILPIANIYCYCLLKNHFHLLLQIKENIPNPSQHFSNLFNAYAKAFNKKYDRVGSLFQRPFKRIQIKDELYFQQLVLYIHLNPELHGLTNNFSSYKFSSYQSIISKKETHLKRGEMISWFDSVENFVFVHEKKKFLNEKKMKALILE